MTSFGSWLRSLTSDQRDAVRTETLRLLKTGKLTSEQLREITYTWEFWARDKQLAPAGDWTYWLILAGRAFGKTRTGGEFVKEKALEHPGCRIALVAPTFADARDTMVEGESGLLSILELPQLRGGTEDAAWNRSIGELFLANGSRFRCFSSEKGNRLRGPQHHFAWCDELSSFEDAAKGDALKTTWSNLKLGLRLGTSPRCVITTTPQPNALTKAVIGSGRVHQTTGSTYENIANVSGEFREIIKGYEGTTIGRQELYAELLKDTEGALWAAETIDACRISRVKEELARLVVAIDPQGSSKASANAAGIIVAGRGKDTRHGYCLDDLTCDGGPEVWAREAVNAYHKYEADMIVAESNFGGEMIRMTLRAVDPTVPVKLLHASRGKKPRAEPIAALYEQTAKGLNPLHHVWHVGSFPELEEEMTTWTPEAESPNRMDALVWAFTDLMLDSQGVSVTSYRSDPDSLVVRRGDLVFTGRDAERFRDKPVRS